MTSETPLHALVAQWRKLRRSAADVGMAYAGTKRGYEAAGVCEALERCTDELSALLTAGPQETKPDVELDYIAILNGAKSIVNASVLYRRFIDGTSLENDIAVWMADFAMQAVKAHGKHVANFLNELYAVMVDPCAEGPIKVKDMKSALLAAAIRDRDAAEQHPVGPQETPRQECEICRVSDGVSGSIATICAEHYRRAVQAEADAEETPRLRALAWEGANYLHNFALLQFPDDTIHQQPFNTCPHPNCVLVRLSAPEAGQDQSVPNT